MSVDNSNLVAKAAVPDGKVQDDSSKLKTFLMILKKFIGVSDMAAVRFSLPAQLMEPVPNLEYWNYLDRPDTFAAIGDSDDAEQRMLACLKFWFTKDLKYVKGKPCKPYNSTLGEFFRCSWLVDESSTPPKNDDAQTNGATNGASQKAKKPRKVSYLTEQTSHHPPVSAFVYEAHETGVFACGYDQLSAKFTGTSIRVTPGQYNQGIFITLRKRDNEEYVLTHPAAYLGGFIRGNLNVTVSDSCSITCEKTGIKVLLHYLEEGYFGKTQNKVEGVMFKFDNKTDSITKISDVPDSAIIGRIEGSWREQIYFARGATPFKKVSDSDKMLLVDLNPLQQASKICPPIEQQLPNESRRFWAEVTDAILAKQYSTATAQKQQLEETQRQKANHRKEKLKQWQPRYFTTVTESDGRPALSEEGKKALQGLDDENYTLELPEEYGAF
ncbi:hypothetical protein BDY17DRAFT_325426 [Neohortaea acidophila]|uniref:Oxysterol-binding protein n=1 Tax=Neohortaea acidophila TaxID=245834 RepID=A0A6A6PP86_9PEZI|nr:uncharacterized protein BDY17DRAFT_325426 [Neohortaea acidophila]KAF2481920.1 hypothetical protein BDY17DRAFT_325426 [Neohortaea acidophila]